MRTYYSFFLLLVLNILTAQKTDDNHFSKGDFPAGVYMTLEDVLNKKPSSTEEVYFKPAEVAPKIDTIKFPEKVFFFSKQKNKKLLYPLAVSYQGEMYFQTYQKYTNKKDKGYDPDDYSRFCKVTNYGRFIYFEESMRGRWSKAFLGVLNPATYRINGKVKGIVLDIDHKELNMLRDCEDLNNFLVTHDLPEIACDPDTFTIGALRATVDAINKPYR